MPDAAATAPTAATAAPSAGPSREPPGLARALLDASPDPVAVTDGEGRVRAWNEAARRAFGVAEREALGRPLLELIVPPGPGRAALGPDLAPLVGRGVRIEAAGPSGGPFELAVTEASGAGGDAGTGGGGRRLVVHLREAPAAAGRNPAEPARFGGVSEAEIRAMVEDQTEHVSLLGPDYRVRFANRVHARFLGDPDGTAAGVRMGDTMPAEVWAALRPELDALAPERPVQRGENQKFAPDGSLRWFEWSNRALFDAAGRRTGLIAVGRDVTEHRAAEAALRASEARFLAAAACLPDGLAILDAADRIVFFNPHFAAHLLPHVRRRLAPGAHFPAIIRAAEAEAPVYDAGMGPDFRARRFGPARDALADHEQHIADGRWLSVRESRTPDGGRVLLLRDVTARKAAEAALRASEATFRGLVEDQTELVCRYDAGLDLTFCNEATCRLYGMRREALLGTPLSLTVPPELRAGLEAELRALTPERPIARASHLERLPSGEERWLEWTNRALFDGDGRFVGVLSVGRDVTERRRAEAALAESEARLAAFLRHAPVGMHVKSLDGRYLVVNPEMERLLGQPAAAILGRRSADLLAPGQAADLDALHRAVARTGVAQVDETQTPPSGAYAWARTIRFPLRDAAGAVTAVGAFVVDVTAQKRAEAELRASEQRFRTIAEAAPLPLNVARLSDRRLLFVNRPYLEALGLGEGDLEGLDRSRLYDDPADREAIFRAIVAGRGVENMELKIRRLDGTAFPVTLTARPVLYDGEPAVVTSFADLSERKAAEAEIERQREALHQGEKLAALGSLLAGVAHELNNPLSVVLGRAIMLEEEVTDAGTARTLAALRAAAERCARIVRTFLAVARQQPRERRRVHPEAQLDAALEMLAYGLRTADVEVVRDYRAGPSAALDADEDALQQVFLNLVVNAQQALQERPRPRRLEVATRIEGGRLAIAFADNGPGVPAGIRPRVFDPFFTTKPQGVGTGIGLSVCHGIVLSHGGTIELGHPPGGGAAFTVRLPLAGPPGPGGPEAGAGSGAAPGPPRGDGAAVLVVDDEPEVAAMLRDVLAREGHAVTVSGDGADALARLAAAAAAGAPGGGRPFDLVVTDLRMPGLDGRELLRRLADAPGPAPAVIVLTGDALASEAALAGLDPAPPLIEKPVDPARLRRAVDLALAERRRGRGFGAAGAG